MNTKEVFIHTTKTKNKCNERYLGQSIGFICVINNMNIIVCSFCKSLKEFNEVLTFKNHMHDFHGLIMDSKIFNKFLLKKEFIAEKFEESQKISLNSEFNKNSLKHEDNLTEKRTYSDDCKRLITTKVQDQNLLMKNVDETIQIHSKQFYCSNCKSNFKLGNELLEHICSYGASTSAISIRSNRNIDMHLLRHSLGRTRKCHYCLKRFYTSVALKNHLMIHTHRRSFKCEYCDKTFRTSILVRRHRKLIHPELPNKRCSPLYPLKYFKKQSTINDKCKHMHQQIKTEEDEIQTNEFYCNQCDKDFKLEDELRQHICLKTKTFQCTKCARSFSSKEYFSIHMRIHSGEKSYKCELCSLAFYTNSLLSDHVAKHEMKRYKCDYENCNRSFTKKCFLFSHIRSHTGPYKCELCPLAFYKNFLLKEHFAKHTKERYKCEYENCGRSYSLKSSLVSHIRSHTGEKPFKCELCNSAFHRSFSLKHHIRRKHTGERYKCEYENCNRSYSLKSTLVSHIRTHTHIRNNPRERFKCEYENCNRSYTQKCSLLFHIRSHTEDKPYKCEICSLVFSNSDLLTKHMSKHTAERYKCEYENCDRSYSRKSSLVFYIQSHTGEKSYKCAVCPLAFYNSNLLKKHMTKHTGERYKCEYEYCDRSYSCKSSLLFHIRSHTEENPSLENFVPSHFIERRD